MISIDQLKVWMSLKESEHLEFKEAKDGFDHVKLIRYCCAISNEGGGHFVLGISDKIPRKIIGCRAFLNLDKIKTDLISKLHIRIDIEEIIYENKRILVFNIPSRPIGMPIHYEGAYWMRRGEELVPMLPDMLKRIFEEGEPDFSAQICPHTTVEDLNVETINLFREMWIRKSGNGNLKNLSIQKLLHDIELVNGKDVTYAALILFGTQKALTKYLAQTEVIFEYRSNNILGPAQQRIEYRQGFFSFYNELWEKINLRNEIQHFQDGLFIWDIPTFNEKVIREAVLNAVSHRDYSAAGSIWIKQFPRKIIIASPGGFPPGINPDNMLWKQQPRNRRIAEVFSKCGLVERAGQGADRIFEESIKQGKPLPSFSHTDDHEVVLTLDGQVEDENFLRFLEKIGQESLATFSSEDFLILNLIHREQSIPPILPDLKRHLKRLIDLGIIEQVGQGRGTKYLLCRQFYKLSGQSGAYTRRRGLDKGANKELLLKHIRDNIKTGSRLSDLCQVLPFLSKDQVQRLIKELHNDSLVEFKGKTKASLWFPIMLK